MLVVASYGALTLAHGTWAGLAAGGGLGFPSVADAFHILAGLLLLSGIVILTRVASPNNDPFGAFEVAITAIAIGVGVWLIVVEPLISNDEFAPSEIVWAGAVSVVGGLAFAAAVRHD